MDLEKVNYSDLEVVLRDCKKELALSDFIYFNKEAMGHPDVTRETYGELADILTKSPKHTLVLMPRGTLKSEIVEAFMIWSLLHNPNLRILYILETKQKAIAYLKGLKDHIESERFAAIFGNMKNESVWREDAIRVKGRTANHKEHSVMLGSLESGTLTGMHYDLIVADDLHSQANTRTAYQIELAKSVFTELVNLGVEGSRQVVLGTVWLDNDIYCTVAKKQTSLPWEKILEQKYIETDYWNIYIRQAIDPCKNGADIDVTGYNVFESSKIVFPKLPLNLLVEKFNAPTMTRYEFACQYLCNPEESKNTEFTKEDLEDAISRYKQRALVRTMLLVDPAYSISRRSDFSAFIYCGYDCDGLLQVELALKEKMEAEAVVDHIFSLRMAHRPHLVAIEANSTQILAKWVKQKRVEKQQFFKIIELKTPHSAKQLRIKALKSLFKAKKIAINPECIDLLEELRNFPNSEHDDLSDCLSFILNEAIQRVSGHHDKQIEPKRGRGPFRSLPKYRPIR